MRRAQAAEDCAADPWTAARLGGTERAEAYLARHSRLAAEEIGHLPEGQPRPDEARLEIFENRMSYETPYISWEMAQGELIEAAAIPENPEFAHAHLLSIGGTVFQQRSGTSYAVLATEASPHDWSDGTRFAGVRPGPCHDIHPGLDLRRAMREMPDMLWRENTDMLGFDLVIESAGRRWTAYPKVGDSLDSGEPMCAVLDCGKVGEPVSYRKAPTGYYGFFKYPLSDVRRMAPAEANAYEIVGGPWTDGEMQEVRIQFLRITADRSRRMARGEEIYRDDSLVVALAEAQAAAKA